MLKALNIWLPAYLRRTRSPARGGIVDVMLCVCDHYEPFHHASKPEAMARVELWRDRFPKLTEEFHDADGVRPKQTFFYPIEQYDRDVMESIAALCRATDCETEMHLHHQEDTAENLRSTLEKGKEDLASHGLLSRDASEAIRFGFIHGNWALDNSHPKGLHCGVCNELAVLASAGCYADFTMPSAPSPTQTRMINSVYRATSNSAPKSHDTGKRVCVGGESKGNLLIVQGPLGLNWRKRKFGILPRIENADLTGVNPPTPDRLKIWLDLNIHVLGRPEWMFVKLHTHGAVPANSAMLLGGPMRTFYEHLQANRALRIHYVTAREMVNIIHAAEDGHTGNPKEYRDYRYKTLIKR